MFSDATVTFKTRRKCWLLATTLTFCIAQFASAEPISFCPEFCECYVNRNGLQTATCTEVFWNGTQYPNIHVVTLKTPDVDVECYIPEDVGQIFPQLNFFELNNCSLTYIPSNSFRDLKSLEEVDLSHNQLKKFSPSLFASNTKLRYVNLENNPLNLGTRSLLRSNSIWEINLSSCNLRKLTPNTFKGLPNLKYLTLTSNKIETIQDKIFPDGLKKLIMADNGLKSIPTSEVIRLKRIRELDFSRNPINCTCSLINFQNWITGRGVIFLKHVQCAEPKQFAGRALNSLPEYELCDAAVFKDTASSAANQILPEEGFVMDQAHVEDDFREFIPVDNKKTRSEQTAKREVEGSGDSESESTTGSNNPEDDDAITTEPSNNSVTSVSQENKNMSSAGPLKNASEEESSNNVDSKIVPTNDKRTINNNEKSFMNSRYIVPTLLIVAVVLVCLSVYISQHSCRLVKSCSESPEPKSNNTTEMQEVSLLPPTDRPKVQIERFGAKYETEGNVSQTEKLMENNDYGEEIPEQSGYSNGHYLDTNENVPEIVRSTVRVTVIPDSVPKTPTIVRKS